MRRHACRVGVSSCHLEGVLPIYDFIDEAAWLDMLKDRNTNVHIYDNKLAQDLIQRILNVYIPAFCQLRDGLMERYGELLMAPDDQFV